LIDLALDEARNNSKLAVRYADIAWGISTRFNVRLNEKRSYFCRFCKAFLAVPGAARYRLSKKRKSMNITCTACGKSYRKMIIRQGDIKRAING
jgi:RNase P subunit RPR2